MLNSFYHRSSAKILRGYFWNKYSMAVKDIASSLKSPTMPYLRSFQEAPIVKMIPPYLQYLRISFVLGWISFPSANLRKSFWAKTLSRLTYFLPSFLIFNSFKIRSFSNGNSIWNSIICRINWCPNWLRGKRNAKSLSLKLIRMPLESVLKEACLILNRISKTWKIRKRPLLYNNST